MIATGLGFALGLGAIAIGGAAQGWMVAALPGLPIGGCVCGTSSGVCAWLDPAANELMALRGASNTSSIVRALRWSIRGFARAAISTPAPGAR